MTPEKITTERSDAVAEKTKVRVTIEPDVVREVDDVELIDLQRMGLLHSWEHTDHAADVLPGDFKAPNRWKAPAKGEDIVEAPAPATATKEG